MTSLVWGRLFIALLTNRPPGARLSVEVDEQTRSESCVAPRQVDPRIPMPLEAICMKALAGRPEDRYPSAMELAEDIERWLADEPVSAMPEPWGDNLRRWGSRNRTLVTSFGAALLVGSILGGIAWRNAGIHAVELQTMSYVSAEKTARELLHQRRQGWTLNGLEKIVKACAHQNIGSIREDAERYGDRVPQWS